MKDTEKFALYLSLGILKACAKSGEYTLIEFLKTFDSDEDYNIFVESINIETKMINGILYVTDFSLKE